MSTATDAPIRVHGSKISYFTGKWESLAHGPRAASGYDPEGRAPFGVGLGLFDR